MTVKLHGCRRCGGDLFVDKDEDGWFEQCLLCSHRQDLIVVPRNQVLERTHIRLETSGIANINANIKGNNRKEKKKE